ncbi:MAG: ABC transporter permease subunit [Actinomycetota bacterium]
MAVEAPSRSRVPNAEEVAPPSTVAAPVSPWPRRIAWSAAIVAALWVGLELLTPGFPETWVVGVADWFASVDTWVIENQRTHWLFLNVLSPISDGVESAVEGTVDALARMTWLGLLVGAASLAGIVAGWRLALLTAAGVATFGILGVWEASLETLGLVLVSVVIALAIGMPLGIWAGRRPKVERALRTVLDAMQTIPAYSYLLPAVLFFGIGYPPALIATVIFAIPPAVRLTALGIRNVPPTAVEVSDSFGATPRQTLGKVQLPMAKPSMMLGVNQTIMMALGMVVIAAVVGAGGLGRQVLDGLKQLDVGEALNGGIAIVAMAIVLDRVTTAWSKRDRRDRGSMTVAGHVLSRRVVIAAALGATVAAVIVGRQVLLQQEWPEGLTTSVAGPANAIVEWSQTNLVGFTDWIARVMLTYMLDPLRDLLAGLPWWMVAGGAALIAWKVSGIRLAIFSFLCVMGIGLLGTWEISMITLSQVLVAVAIAVAIAIPIGIAAARSPGLERAIRPVLDAMQTMPAFVYLVPVLLLFAPGRVPAVIASVVYAFPVGIRLTTHGIREVPSETVEASESFGATPRQTLRKVQLPLARPQILLGVNQVIMMVLAVVIIAGLIGGGGLGFDILNSLSKRQIGQAVVGGLNILLLAIVLDRITQAMGAAQRSMRGPVGMGFGWWTRVRAIKKTEPMGTNGPGKGDA